MDEYNILRKKTKKNAFAATAILASIALILLGLVIFLFLLGRADKTKKNTNVTDNGSNITENTNSTSNNGSTSNENSSESDLNNVTDSNGNCAVGSKEQVFNNNLKTIKDAAVSYFTTERLPKNIGDTKKLTLREMQDKKLVSNITDGNGKKVDAVNSYVEVTKEKNEYVMKINLTGSDISDYILIHIGCYDYCKSTVCEKQDEQGKTEFEYEYKKTTSCVMSDWSSWSEWKTTREKTSNTKKEDTKVVTSKKTVTDTKYPIKGTTTYNCNKYGSDYKLDGKFCVKTVTSKEVIDATPSNYSYVCEDKAYELNGTKCEKTITVTDKKDATPNPTTYNCDKYPGYDLNKKNNKCEKVITVKEEKPATAEPTTYNCDKYPGYDVSGSSCVKTIKDQQPATAVLGNYHCNNYPGYDLKGTSCVKTTQKFVAVSEIPVYDTRKVKEPYSCNKQVCTTKNVLNSKGQMVPQTSCETKKKTCYKEVDETYLSGYYCPNQYVNGQCGKYVPSTDTKSASRYATTYNCNKYGSNYKLSGTTCIMSYVDRKDATPNPTKYNCKSYPGFDLKGTSCIKEYSKTLSENATPDPITYNCDKYGSNYKVEGKYCVAQISHIETMDAKKVIGGYTCKIGKLVNNKCEITVNKDYQPATTVTTKDTCPTGYDMSNNKCIKITTQEIKTTYYRYATRSCVGGSTVYAWSNSSDKSLLTAGYKLTGKKRAITVTEK